MDELIYNAAAFRGERRGNEGLKRELGGTEFLTYDAGLGNRRSLRNWKIKIHEEERKYILLSNFRIFPEFPQHLQSVSISPN